MYDHEAMHQENDNRDTAPELSVNRDSFINVENPSDDGPNAPFLLIERLDRASERHPARCVLM